MCSKQNSDSAVASRNIQVGQKIIMETSSRKKEDRPKPTKGLTETRYIFVLMTFLGTVLSMADRTLLNVAIVGMVDRCKQNLLTSINKKNYQ